MELLNQVLEIVKEAAKFCKREEVEVYCKEGNSNFVTTADLNVENFLKEKLLELLPDSGFVGWYCEFYSGVESQCNLSWTCRTWGSDSWGCL